MRWNYKQLAGLVILVVGIVGIFVSRHYMQRISDAKSDIGFFTSPFKDAPGGGLLKRGLMGEASQYDTQVQLMMYGSIALVIVGLVMLYLYWYKKKK